MKQEDRIISIESSLAHLEQTIESLNQTVIEQERTIQNLQNQIWPRYEKKQPPTS